MELCGNTVDLILQVIKTSPVSNGHIDVFANQLFRTLINHLLHKIQLSNWFDELELMLTLRKIVDEFEVDAPSDVEATIDDHA